VDTKPEILSAEKLKSRVLSSQTLNSQPPDQHISYSKQKKKLKKLIDVILDYHEHKKTLEQMNAKDYNSESVFAFNGLFIALDNLVNRTKFKNKLQSFLSYQIPFSAKKYYNTINMLKTFINLNLNLTSFQKIKKQLELRTKYF
jgi:hypothetical protein